MGSFNRKTEFWKPKSLNKAMSNFGQTNHCGQIFKNSCFNLLSQFLCLANAGINRTPPTNPSLSTTSSSPPPLPHTPPPQDPSSRGPPQISHFLLLSRQNLHSFFPLLDVFLCNVGGVFEGRGPEMCTFGLSGCRLKPQPELARTRPWKQEDGVDQSWCWPKLVLATDGLAKLGKNSLAASWTNLLLNHRLVPFPRIQVNKNARVIMTAEVDSLTTDTKQLLGDYGLVGCHSKKRHFSVRQGKNWLHRICSTPVGVKWRRR